MWGGGWCSSVPVGSGGAAEPFWPCRCWWSHVLCTLSLWLYFDMQWWAISSVHLFSLKRLTLRDQLLSPHNSNQCEGNGGGAADPDGLWSPSQNSPGTSFTRWMVRPSRSSFVSSFCRMIVLNAVLKSLYKILTLFFCRMYKLLWTYSNLKNSPE